MSAGLILGTVIPGLAIDTVSAAMSGGYTVGASDPTKGPAPMVGNPAAEPPVFRSSVTVWNPAWILIGIVVIWFIASKGGRK